MHRHTFPQILLIVLVLLTGCSNDAPNTKLPEQQPAETVPAPSPVPDTATVEVQNPAETAPKEPQESPRTESDAKPNARKVKPNLPPDAAPTRNANPAGNPTGYISRKQVILQKEPTKDAAKIASLDIYQAVIILETKMTDEAGKSFDIPQWYKVQLANKQTGWVASRSVTVN